MSELINNSKYRKTQLKKLILKIHEGESPDKVRKELMSTLQEIPYGEVVEVEQELIREGLPEQEILRLCDIHGEVLKGNVDLSAAKKIPPGHPVDVFMHENKELLKVAGESRQLLNKLDEGEEKDFKAIRLKLLGCYNELIDVDKHYLRKENLLFPYLEKNDITGPPQVLWGKHDEIRDQLKACIELLRSPQLKKTDLFDSLELLFYPALKGVEDMVQKEEEILFPMCMDVLTTGDWWDIHEHTVEIGFTLYDPQVDWKPEGFTRSEKEVQERGTDGTIQLPSGSFTPSEIMAILNTVPVDMTFVDRNDKVKYFTQGKERIFTRSRSILNRDVRMCHPPGSVHVVEKIVEDFKSGKASHAPFWIQLRGKFIHIEYFALRDEKGEYLGTLEVSQDLTDLRNLEGEKRILSYTEKDD